MFFVCTDKVNKENKFVSKICKSCVLRPVTQTDGLVHIQI